MKKMTALAAIAGLAALTGAAQAADVNLTFSHWIPATHPLQVTGFEPWAKSINKDSDGRIKITIYPSQQLGAAADHYDMTRDGVVDIGFVNPGYTPGRFPILSAGELPFLISNGKGGSRALDEWYQPYAKKEMKDVYVCMVFAQQPGTLHGKSGRLEVPGDLKGKNVRPADATLARMVTSVGGASVQVAAPEIRELLAKGGADITASPWGSLFTFGLDSIVKSHLDMPLYVTNFAIVMNKARFESMAPKDQKVIADHCTPKWAEKMASGWADFEAAGRQKIIDEGGHTLYKPTPDEVKLWKDAAAPLTDDWKKGASKAGIDANAAYDGLVTTLKKYDSLVK